MSGLPAIKQCPGALFCIWEGQAFTHSFLIMPECPSALLGRDLLKMEAEVIFWPYTENCLWNLQGALLTSPSPIPTQILKGWDSLVNPDTWDQGTSGRAISTTSIMIQP